jgi:multiple sugar transport system substrate-binding protein
MKINFNDCIKNDEKKIKMSLTLKGISWDHPRGYQPLRAAAELWKQQTGITINWDVRTLQEFGDFPVEKLIGIYDFIIIDHPYMGEASSKNLLIELNKYLPQEFLNIQEQLSVGPSYESYEYRGNMYALPVDAAAQVAACRKDIVDKINWTIHGETTGLKEAASLLPNEYCIAVPLCPTDIWCVFLSLCAQYSNGSFFSNSGVDIDAGQWALEQIRDWRSFINKASFDMNPIQLLSQMASNDEIIYCPFTFGYTNYSRKKTTVKIVNFLDVPRYNDNSVTSLLGGAGIAVSQKTQHLTECLDFINYVLSPQIQQTVYFQNEGQPALLNAWNDEQCNSDSSDFFKNTLFTMQHAYVRPRIPNFNVFQENAADLIHELALNQSAAVKGIILLNNLFRKLCHEKF